MAFTSAMVADVPINLGMPDADGAHGLYQLVQVLLQQLWRLLQRLLQPPHIALVVTAGHYFEMLMLLQEALNPLAVLCKLKYGAVAAACCHSWEDTAL